MKKITTVLLCMLLLLPFACNGQKPEEIKPITEIETEPIDTESGSAPEQMIEAADVTPTPWVESIMDIPFSTPTGEQTEEPGEAPRFEPQAYQPYREVGTGVSEAEMFRCDIDFDGSEEIISFRLDKENDDTIILIDDREVLFDESAQLLEVILVDLDAETPWINLLVEIDWASDDYVTTEVHLENGVPVKGVTVGGVSLDESGNVIVYDRCEFLGTRFLGGVCVGETLVMTEEWFDCRHPAEEEIRDEFDSLVEWGELLYAVREIPCTINGKSAKLAKGSYIYPVRINPTAKLAEVCTADGITAMIAYEIEEDDWPYLIGGIPQEECFDNILFAD